MNRRDVLRGMSALGLAGVAGTGMAQDGFYVPAEEEPHARTFMQWPASRFVYVNPVLRRRLQATIADIANTISEFEPVVLLADPRQHSAIRRLVSSAVELWSIPTEDLWCRDSGPIFATNSAGNLAIRHIQFNGWGDKQVHRKDGRVAERVADWLGLPLLSTPLKGEGGGVEHDGHGLLIAHESSWIIDNRNPGMSRDAVEAALMDAYGAQRMIWSPGLKGEDITDYHIDGLARFTGPGQVLINLPSDPDPEDPFHAASFQTFEVLKGAGLDVDVIKDPVRPRVMSWDFVAAYVNYYVCNGAVIAAQFGDPATDEEAADALRRHYPGREVVMMNVDPLGECGGGIHCATQQMPAV